MSKKHSWLIILPAFFVGVSIAHADPLDKLVNKDLFSSQLSAPKDQEQSEFESSDFKDKNLNIVKVEQAPTPLTAAERDKLSPEARLLWNRVWYYDQGHRDQAQKARVASTIDLYNKMIDDFKIANQKQEQNKDVEKQATGASPLISASQGQVTCVPETNALATENIKTVVIATNAATQAAVEPEEKADIKKAQAEKLDPMPADLKSEALPSAPQKVAVPDGGYLTTMAIDPENPQTVYAMDLLPGVVKVVQGGAVIQKFAYDFVRSDDDGKTWTVVHKLLTTSGDITNGHIAVSNGAKDIFVTTNDGVIDSQDGGKTFGFLPGALSTPVDVKISSDGARLAVSYANGQGIQTFDNQNGSWSKSQSQPSDLIAWVNQQYQTDPRCQEATFNGCPYDTGSNLKVFSVQMDPTQPGVLYAGLGQGEYKYQNGSWSVMQGMEDDTTVNNIEIGANGKMIVSTCNGIYQGQTSQGQLNKVQSTNFVNQKTGSSSPSYLRSYEVSVNSQNSNDVVSVSASGVYISKDGGTSWNRESLGAASGPDALNAGNEFRSAVWLPDGSIEVSSLNGAYRFTP